MHGEIPLRSSHSHEYSTFHTIISPYCRLLKFNFHANTEYIHVEMTKKYIKKIVELRDTAIKKFN
jgi:hypothetical protein